MMRGALAASFALLCCAPANAALVFEGTIFDRASDPKVPDFYQFGQSFNFDNTQPTIVWVSVRSDSPVTWKVAADTGLYDVGNTPFVLEIRSAREGYLELLSTFTNQRKTAFVRIETVGVVPEPETWVMMIAGVGMAGAAARPRRRGPVAA